MSTPCPRVIATLCLLSALLLAPRASAAAAAPSHLPLCLRGLSLVKAGSFDSALIAFQEAANAGMSADSMYYFFAQVFMAKGALDTALALNLSAHPRQTRSPVRAALLRQRLSIYRALNWESETGRTEDSLFQAEGGVAGCLLPQLSALARAGAYRQRSSYGEDNIGVLAAPDSAAEVVNSPAGLAIVNLLWRTPQWGPVRPFVGLAGRLDKVAFVRPVRTDSTLWDSTGLAGGCRLGLDIPRRRLRLQYAWERRRDPWGYLLSVNDARLSLGLPWGKAYLSTEVRYTGHLASESWLGRHQGGVEAAVYRSLGDRLTFSAELDGGLNVQPARGWASLGIDRYHIVSADQPLAYYRDPSCTDTIARPASTFPLDPSVLAYRRAVLEACVPDTLQALVPQGYWSAEPAATLRLRMGHRSRAALRASWRIQGYLQPASWHSLDLPPGATLAEAPRVARSEADGRDYLLVGLQEHGYDTCIAIVKNTAARVDNTANVNLSFDRDLGAVGRVSATVYASKTWSTLPASAPMPVPGWTLGISLAAALDTPDR